MMAAAIRILFVDDEPALLDIGKVILEQSGDFTVTTATSAPEASRLLEKERFDAIISDYQMPEMNGIQFLVEVRTRFGLIPFILFTGKGREDVVIQAINRGADFYLQKGGEPKAEFAELSYKIRQAASTKRADDALKKTVEDYRHLIGHTDEGIVIAQDGMLRLVNPRAVEFTGYSEQELLSMPFPVLIHPDDRALVVERYQKRLKGEEVPSRYAFRLNSKDGSTRWVELSVAAIEWDGHPATLNFLTDISEQKRAEEALRESEERYRAIYDQSPIAIELCDATGALVHVNPAYLKLFGIENMQAIQNFSLFSDPDINDTQKEKLHQGKTVQYQGPFDFEKAKTHNLYPTNREGIIWLDVLITPLGSGADSIPGFLVQIQDITERKRAEDALALASRKMNVMSSITWHDILNQITALRIYIELAKEEKDTKMLAKISSTEEKIADTLERQINFAREYQHIGATAPVWQNVNASIQKAISTLPIRAIHIELDPADPDVYADPLFFKVFYNLINNALSYGGDQMKIIRISSQESGTSLTIVCEDDGVGITAEDKKHLFTRGLGKNTGLGLFLSQEILSITGITITENGTPGKGARFEIHVPAAMWRIKGVNQ